MKAFNDLNLQDLHWIERNGFTSRQELRDSDDQVIATIEKEKWWNNRYIVDAPGNRWLFQPRGFFGRRIEIYATGTGDLVTTFEYKGLSGGGQLTLPDGRLFRWQSLSMWGNKWAWLEGTDDSDPVIGFETGGFFRARANLTFDEETDFPSLLVFLGWYLHTLQRQQQTASVVAAT